MYIVHCSLILLLAISVIGSIFGFDAYVNITEGDSTGTVRLMNIGEPLDLGFSRKVEEIVTELQSLAMACASFSTNVSDRIQPLLPALKSNWLITHVIACFIGCAAFAIAFGINIMYLMKNRSKRDSGGFLSRFPKSHICMRGLVP